VKDDSSDHIMYFQSSDGLFSPFSIVFSNQRFSNFRSTVDVGFVTLSLDCFGGNGLKMTI